MVLDGLGEVNYLAALVAAIAWWALGALWYAPPVLGRAWMRSEGLTMEEVGQGPRATGFIVSILAYFLAAIVTAALAVLTNSTTFADGIALGLMVGVGYALTLTAVGTVFARPRPEPLMWFLINGLYNVLGLVIVGVIVSLWR